MSSKGEKEEVEKSGNQWLDDLVEYSIKFTNEMFMRKKVEEDVSIALKARAKTEAEAKAKAEAATNAEAKANDEARAKVAAEAEAELVEEEAERNKGIKASKLSPKSSKSSPKSSLKSSKLSPKTSKLSPGISAVAAAASGLSAVSAVSAVSAAEPGLSAAAPGISKSSAVAAKDSDDFEEYDDNEIDQLSLEKFIKSSSKALPVSAKASPAAAKASPAAAKASHVAAKASPAPAAVVKSSMPKKIKPSIFREYNLNNTIVSELQSGHNIFHKYSIYRSVHPATDPHATKEKQTFYFFNIDEHVSECMHLTITPKGIHLTLDLIKDPTKNKIKYINFNLEFSRSTRELRILSDNGTPITPEYISTIYNRALLELNSEGSGGAGAKAVDYSYCQFEMKADILLKFLYDMIPKCIQRGVFVLEKEIAGGNYYEKYMKYKIKYLKLKQLMESI